MNITLGWNLQTGCLIKWGIFKKVKQIKERERSTKRKTFYNIQKESLTNGVEDIHETKRDLKKNVLKFQYNRLLVRNDHIPLLPTIPNARSGATPYEDAYSISVNKSQQGDQETQKSFKPLTSEREEHGLS